jgi:hypothetical protein
VDAEGIEHLIDDCELSLCRCKLHKVPSPFCFFPQREEETQFPSEVEENALESIPKPLLPGNEESYFHIGSLIPSVTGMEDRRIVMSKVQKNSTFRPYTPNESEAGDGDYFGAYASY